MNDAGYIKLHRKVLGHEIYRDERFCKGLAWIDLLLLANHAPRSVFIRGIELHVNRGELCYSETTLATRWRWNRRTVDNFLKRMQMAGMVHIRKSRLTTVITIQNYSRYQDSAQQNAQQSAHKQEEGRKTVELMKILLDSWKADTSVYDLVGKFKPELGEDQLRKILGGCIGRGQTFANEGGLAAYLSACCRNNGNAMRQDIAIDLRTINRGEPGYV